MMGSISYSILGLIYKDDELVQMVKAMCHHYGQQAHDLRSLLCTTGCWSLRNKLRNLWTRFDRDKGRNRITDVVAVYEALAILTA